MFDRSQPMSKPEYVQPEPTGDIGTDLINEVKAKRFYEQSLVEWDYRMKHGGAVYLPYIIQTTVAQIPVSNFKPRMLLKSRYAISNISTNANHNPNHPKV